MCNVVGFGGPVRAWLTVRVLGDRVYTVGLRCLPNGPLAITMTLALSVALSVCVAEVMLLLGVWNPLAAQALVFVIATPFLLLQTRHDAGGEGVNPAFDHWSSVVGIAMAVLAVGAFVVYEAMGPAVRGDADAVTRAMPLRWVGWFATVLLVIIVVARFLVSS